MVWCTTLPPPGTARSVARHASASPTRARPSRRMPQLRSLGSWCRLRARHSRRRPAASRAFARRRRCSLHSPIFGGFAGAGGARAPTASRGAAGAASLVARRGVTGVARRRTAHGCVARTLRSASSSRMSDHRTPRLEMWSVEWRPWFALGQLLQVCYYPRGHVVASRGREAGLLQSCDHAWYQDACECGFDSSGESSVGLVLRRVSTPQILHGFCKPRFWLACGPLELLRLR